VLDGAIEHCGQCPRGVVRQEQPDERRSGASARPPTYTIIDQGSAARAPLLRSDVLVQVVRRYFYGTTA
jgi:hypothetical protein